MSVVLHTTVGDLEVQLHKEYPFLSYSFLVQAASGAYDGLAAKRNLKGFLVQFPLKAKCLVQPETKSVGIKHEKGSVGLCKAPRSGFYIAYAPQPLLDEAPVFGHVSSGFEVLDEMEKADSVVIESVEVKTNPFAEAEKDFATN